ncbi:MAG TPA: methyltransferase [Verrucomicrobiae bacterium]|nr:methyltransferase [Verrucomicrobiae bacterium]
MPPVRDLIRGVKRRLKAFRTAGRPDLDQLLNGYRHTAMLYVAAKLRLPDRLSDLPRSSAELAAQLPAHEPSLNRLLRGLVALGICAQDSAGKFHLTAIGKRLQSTYGGSHFRLALLNGEEYAPAWNHLLHSVRTGEAAFDHAFGQSPWEHRRANPELNESFNQWLEHGATAAGRALVKALDFSRYPTVADVGGGNGWLLAEVLRAHSTVRAMLVDQPHVIEAAQPALTQAGLAGRIQFHAVDFFEAIPAGADLYILKSILHDWNDLQCLTILKRCHAAMRAGQPLLVIERLLPRDATENSPVILGDLHMLAVTGGQERTLQAYESLLVSAGFRMENVTHLRTGHALVKVTRAP